MTDGFNDPTNVVDLAGGFQALKDSRLKFPNTVRRRKASIPGASDNASVKLPSLTKAQISKGY